MNDSMNDESHTVCWPDQAWHGTATIGENVRLARDTYRVRFECPEIARRITPGQFLMLRLSGRDDPLLGRPLALYDTVLDREGQPRQIDVVYLTLGKMTRMLAQCAAGQKLDLWGPLGNGFSLQPAKHLIMVAGGIGQTPFLALARRYAGLRTYGTAGNGGVRLAEKITLCYGARNREFFAGLEDFQALGIDVRLSTDDGSAGHHGLVTAVLEQVLDGSTRSDCRIVCCGPEPMMAAVAGIAARRQAPCEVSLESPMACGIGICFSCVAKVRTAEGWDYRRTCVEGPVFDSARIEF